MTFYNDKHSKNYKEKHENNCNENVDKIHGKNSENYEKNCNEKYDKIYNEKYEENYQEKDDKNYHKKYDKIYQKNHNENYLEHHNENCDKNEEYLIYVSILAILGHFLLLFFSAILGVLCLGLSYGCFYSVFMHLIEKNQQKEDYIFIVSGLGIIILSYILAFFSLNGAFYHKCEIIVILCTIVSFFIAVRFFHQCELDLKEKNGGNEGFRRNSEVSQENSIEMEDFKNKRVIY